MQTTGFCCVPSKYWSWVHRLHATQEVFRVHLWHLSQWSCTTRFRPGFAVGFGWQRTRQTPERKWMNFLQFCFPICLVSVSLRADSAVLDSETTMSQVLECSMRYWRSLVWSNARGNTRHSTLGIARCPHQTSWFLLVCLIWTIGVPNFHQETVKSHATMCRWFFMPVRWLCKLLVLKSFNALPMRGEILDECWGILRDSEVYAGPYHQNSSVQQIT